MNHVDTVRAALSLSLLNSDCSSLPTSICSTFHLKQGLPYLAPSLTLHLSVSPLSLCLPSFSLFLISLPSLFPYL
jgi:hypothetical protein